MELLFPTIVSNTSRTYPTWLIWISDRPKFPTAAAKLSNPTSASFPKHEENACFRHLTWLSLQFAHVSDRGMEFIGGISSLKNFYLYGVRFTNDTLRHLSKATQLKRLELPCTSITDEGMKYITPLKNLTHLRLNNTPVTDRGAVFVTSLRKLEKVDLAFSQVTRRCKDWISTQFSSVTVY